MKEDKPHKIGMMMSREHFENFEPDPTYPYEFEWTIGAHLLTLTAELLKSKKRVHVYSKEKLKEYERKRFSMCIFDAIIAHSI